MKGDSCMARAVAPRAAAAVDHADTELIGHRGWEVTGFLCAGKQPHNGCFLLAEGSSGSPSRGTGEAKANPVTPCVPFRGRGPRSGAGVYDAASRIDTLRRPDCQSAVFPPTSI